MTKFQALFIKLLRCRYDYTYRALYEAYIERYPEVVVKGKQAQGEYIVGLAEITLGESLGNFDVEYKYE